MKICSLLDKHVGLCPIYLRPSQRVLWCDFFLWRGRYWEDLYSLYLLITFLTCLQNWVHIKAWLGGQSWVESHTKETFTSQDQFHWLWILYLMMKLVDDRLSPNNNLLALFWMNLMLVFALNPECRWVESVSNQLFLFYSVSSTCCWNFALLPSCWLTGSSHAVKKNACDWRLLSQDKMNVATRFDEKFPRMLLLCSRRNSVFP